MQYQWCRRGVHVHIIAQNHTESFFSHLSLLELIITCVEFLIICDFDFAGTGVDCTVLGCASSMYIDFSSISNMTTD